MKSIFRVVLTAFLLLPSLTDSRAGDGIPWNQLLDRYELVCKKCLELNALRDSGQYVSSRQLMDVMDELESLRSQLRVASDKMPASARRRFKAIRKMYQEYHGDARRAPAASGCRFTDAKAGDQLYAAVHGHAYARSIQSSCARAQMDGLCNRRRDT